MANTLTGLIPDLYEAVDVVSRELTGFIPAVTMDAMAERAAKDQVVYVPISPTATAEDITPGTTPPDTGDQTFDKTPITITKSRAVPFRWTGEEQKSVNSGPGYSNLRRDQIAQAIRALVNEVETDLAGLYTRASRAHGTAGTTPFASNLSDTAQVLKILLDNGAPPSDLHLVINTTAGANMRSLSQLTKANEAGDQGLLRQGILLDIHGFSIRESAQVKAHTKGTGSGYLVNDATPPGIGGTTITVDTGTGTILAGDVITLAGDTNKYVVGTALGSNVVTINKPGLRAASDDDDAITVGNSYTANMAFHRRAMILAARLPALPEEGDMATDRQVIVDPRTGLAFEFSIYPGYRRVRYEVALAWGVANIKPEFTALLLG